MKPEITLVYDVDCPNVNAARTALGQAIARARLDPGWIECERTTPGLPQRFLRFGSTWPMSPARLPRAVASIRPLMGFAASRRSKRS